MLKTEYCFMNSAPFRLDLSPNSVASEVNQINYA